MSDRPTTENPYGTPSTTGPEPIGKSQARTNKIVRSLLRVPGISRVVGNYLMTLHIVGRKSGKRYDVPVAYTKHDGSLLIGTALRPWVKNLQAGDPVQVSRGRKPEMFVPVVHTAEQDVMRLYAIIAADNKTNAKFNGIGFTADGAPNKADLYQTWQLGGVVIELTPQA
ncbi:nitroreductase/quinone reductase family protein [Nocardia altamirensis]|uniref:nitroreductase/quinone reductase family protein n=1 Tax=Nocardia altamirensis TaxID=472158 RepID=UPI00114D1852|nr:nitroreductase/quinone reductase family protein [Nocardia altamirensis]